MSSTGATLPPSTLECPHCGVCVAPCGGVCEWWDCALGTHLLFSCESPTAVEYFIEVGERAKREAEGTPPVDG